MRLLLDESLPRSFGRVLTGHDMQTVPQMGWSGLSNGELLRRVIESGFDTLLTVYRNLEHQQDVASSGIAVFVLIDPTNRIADLEPLAPQLMRVIPQARSGRVLRVER